MIPFPRPLTAEEAYQLEQRITRTLLTATTENVIEVFQLGLLPDYFTAPLFRQVAEGVWDATERGLSINEAIVELAPKLPENFIPYLINNVDHPLDEPKNVSGQEITYFIMRGLITSTTEACRA